MVFLAFLLIGIAAGLRTLTPLAAVSIAAFLAWIDLSGTWAAFVGHIVTMVILVLLALGEYVGDKLPTTPSRKRPEAFGGRVVSGALSAAVLGLATGNPWLGAALGAVGAVLGTLGGYEGRVRCSAIVKRDLPVALAEDVIAIVLALSAIWLALPGPPAAT